jgi:hypothetical protein
MPGGRQELAVEKAITVSLRTVQRAVKPYRQELEAQARATVRFETPPGKQMQIDFGERLIKIGGAKLRAYLGMFGNDRSSLDLGRDGRVDRHEACYYRHQLDLIKRTNYR